MTVVKGAGAEVTLDEWNTLAGGLMAGVAEAVTEYARRREAEAVQAREEAIAVVSHDLRGPLGIVKGYADALVQVAQ